MGFSREEYRSGLPLPSPGDLPNPGIKPRSPALRADALPSEPPENTQEIWKREGICVHIADSLCCRAETNKIVKQLYSHEINFWKVCRWPCSMEVAVLGGVGEHGRSGAAAFERRWIASQAGFWGKNIPRREEGRSSGEEREDLPQGSSGSEGEQEEVTSQRCQWPGGVGNHWQGWENSTFSEWCQQTLDHYFFSKEEPWSHICFLLKS